jgi:ABC-type polysaccharide/polyol phosphate transport system ATPase subunit
MGKMQGIEVIRLENVSVRYRVPHERMFSLKEYAIRWVQGGIRYEEFMALSDIDLTVYQGETFGLIGRNGAGKSTLLKLVARVLLPTHGRVWVHGRVAPLLEVGAGFHMDLTGRENVFLNGTLLGYSNREIEQNFDRIVEFAELGDFIDAPLRTYSSGMVARLGFSVATDVQPEILIVDEILGVGDEAFQDKCKKRINRFRENGTTILVVSHNMDTVKDLCTRAALLIHGKIVFVGPIDKAIHQYRQHF